MLAHCRYRPGLHPALQVCSPLQSIGNLHVDSTCRPSLLPLNFLLKILKKFLLIVKVKYNKWLCFQKHKNVKYSTDSNPSYPIISSYEPHALTARPFTTNHCLWYDCMELSSGRDALFDTQYISYSVYTYSVKILVV